jgi:phosphate uptake regulator
MEMPRRIQLTGRSTYIVSLPHEWVERNKIGKGNVVYTREERDGSLLLSLKEKQKASKTARIGVRAESDESMKNIVSAYVGGADRIILKGKGVSTLADEARRILSGVEISDEEGDELVLRVVTLEDLDVEKLIRRIYNVTLGMFALAKAFFGSGTGALTEISRKEDEVDRLYLLLLRRLCAGGYPPAESVFNGMVAKSMEKISDHLEDLCRSGKKQAPSSQLAHLVELSSHAYMAAYAAYSGNGSGHGGFSRAREEYMKGQERLENDLGREKSAAKIIMLRSLYEKCSKIARYSEDITESGNDLYFAKME